MIRPFLRYSLLLSLLFTGAWGQEEGLEEIVIKPRVGKKELVVPPTPAPNPPATPASSATPEPPSEAPGAEASPRPPATPAPTPPPAPSAPSSEKEPSAPIPSPSSAGGRALPFKNVINTVDREAKLITIGKKKFHILYIRPETRIERIDGKPGTLEDLEPGQEIRGSYRKLDKVEWEAVSLKFGSKADAEAGTLED